MTQPSVNSTADPEIRARFEAQLTEARETQELSRLVRAPAPNLYPRYSGYYRQLCRLPRRVRRQLQRQWRRSLSAIALLLALGQAPALAATITVTPGIPPAINADGRCALIEAIDNANADAQTHSDCVAGNGADTIVLPTKSTQSLTAADNTTHGPTGLPVITSTVTLQGRHSTIQRVSGTPAFRILAVVSSGDLTLHNTTVNGGYGFAAYLSGGGIANYGGTLKITNSTVSGNRILATGNGGGVYNTGNLTLRNSTVSGNSCVFYSGAGIANSGTATLTHSTVSDNYGAYSRGGGVLNRGILTLSRSTVSDNHSVDGGGVYNRGTAKLIDTTVSGNDTFAGSGSGSIQTSGGGIANTGTLTVINSTVSDNSTGTSGGGGLFNGGRYFEGPIGVLTLSNSTVSGNQAIDGGGGVHNNNGTLILARTLIAGNKSYSGGSEVVDSRFGTVIANDHNLFGHDGDAGVIGFSPGPTDIVPSERLGAILEPLADNGGPTQTHALLAGSPAIGQSPANSGCLPTDQRGVTRPQGSARDIGAFEKGPPVLCNGRIARIIGTVGNDRLIGTPGPDVIHGLAGNDIIYGLEGNDIICGGTGDDKLFGASGADTLNGGSGTDTCKGGSGTDKGASCETKTSIP